MVLRYKELEIIIMIILSHRSHDDITFQIIVPLKLILAFHDNENQPFIATKFRNSMKCKKFSLISSNFLMYHVKRFFHNILLF